MDLQRITEMEFNLGEINAAVVDLNNQIDRLQSLRERAKALYSYYGSEDWYEDRENKLPEGMKAGVLSEDLIYDSITELRDTAFTMLELGTEILKDWI